MIGESAVSNLPSGKMRKYFTVLQDHFLTTEFYILDQKGRRNCGMHMCNDMNMIACSSYNIRMTGLVLQYASNVCEQNILVFY
jgi:hypothetical protein